MTRSAASCKSHVMRATFLIIIASLLLSVDARGRYRGVSKRKDSVFYHCEVTFLGSSPREKVWVGTYPTEELAALACDVVFYYTNRPSDEFNLGHSEEAIRLHCKGRSAYENLHNWNDRRNFIKAEANRLIGLLSSADQAPELRWEDVGPVPTLVSVRKRAGAIAGTIVEHFRNQAERLREFMAWLMHHSDSAQQREAQVIQGLPLLADRILDVHDVTLILESLARPGRTLWLAFIAGSLPMIFHLFNIHTKNNIAGDVGDPNDAKLADRETWQTATKRQKVAQPSIQLVSDRVQGLLTAITLYVRNQELQCTGYDLLSKTWKTLPPFSYLREVCPYAYSVCGHGGLMCALVSKGELVVFNPSTTKKRTLPPLLHPRSPVLMHMIVDSATRSYKVIVAGSSSLKDEHLLKKMEVFDSRTSKWEEMDDLPGPAFGLNDYQTGVCVDGILYFISCLEGGKGVVAFDVENRKWLPSMTCPPPCKLLCNVQLVENDGKLYLFHEDEERREQCIDVLEPTVSEPSAGAVTCQWRNVVQVSKCERGLLVKPEIMCVGFGEGKLCIFNSIEADGVVYDMGSGRVIDVLEPPLERPRPHEVFSADILNPASFILQLSSEIDPTPPSVDTNQFGKSLLIHPFLQLP